MSLLLLLLLATTLIGADQGYQCSEKGKKKNISVLLVNSLYSGHLIPLVSLGEKLMRRGHSVTLVANVLKGSHTYQDIFDGVGIKFISSGYDEHFTQTSLNNFHEGLHYGEFGCEELVTNLYRSLSSSALQVKNKVEEIGENQFDIIICDIGIYMVGVHFHIRRKKVIIFNPLVSDFVRIEEWPTPLLYTGQSSDLSFIERLFNKMIFKPLFNFGISALQKAIAQEDKDNNKVFKYKDATNYFRFVGTQIPMIIVASFGFEYPRARLPLVEYVGPILFHKPPELSSDLKQWLDSKSPQTVIYVSMGTTATVSSSSTEAILDGILTYTSYSCVWVMKEKDRHIVQKLNSSTQASRLYLASWVAQQSLLRHRAISLSIIHCGMNTVHESIMNSHPVICIPSVFDQFDVATRVVSAGVGVSLYDRMDKLLGNNIVTSQMVVTAINTVSMSNYSAYSILRLKRMFQISGGGQRAADLTEFYEDVGYDHLVPAYVKYQWNWIQFYNYDVGTALAVTMGLILCCCWKLYSYFKKFHENCLSL